MADNKNLRDQNDRRRVSGDEDYELGYLVDKMGVTREQIKEAIDKVGNDRTKIEEFLRRHK